MKKTKMIAVLSFLAVSLLIAGAAYAATATATLDVSAWVGAACTVQTTPVDFGQYDDANITYGSGDITVTCPAAFPYNIALDAGLHYDEVYRTVSDGINQMEYGIGVPGNPLIEWGDSDYDNTYPNGASISDVGDGSPQPHVFDAAIPPQGVFPDGVYSDTVGVTVYY